jgi:hypothetical protein
MINRIADISQRKTALVAGIAYLIVIVSGVFTYKVARGSLVVPGDAVTTINNIMANELLFRTAIVSELIMLTGWLLLGLCLYVLFKPVNKNIAMSVLILFLVGVAVQASNMINHLAVLQLLSGADYLTVFQTDQLHAQVMFHIDLFDAGYYIAAIFFSLVLLPIGYLAYKSSYFPRILGLLLIIGSFGLLIDHFTFFLFPSHIAMIGLVVTIPGSIAELVLCAWLLLIGALKGGKIPKEKPAEEQKPAEE